MKSVEDKIIEVLNELEKWESRKEKVKERYDSCLLYTSPSPRDRPLSRMPSSA